MLIVNEEISWGVDAKEQYNVALLTMDAII